MRPLLLGAALLPLEIEVPAGEIHHQGLLTVGAEMAGNGGIVVVILARRVDLHTDIMPAGGDGKRKGETSSPGACPVGQMRVGIQGAAQLVMVAKIAVHPDVDLAAAEWILT